MKKCILLASGGLDTQISMAMLNEDGYDILPIYFDYGQQTSKKEIPALKKYSNSILGKDPEIRKLDNYTSVLENMWALSGDVSETYNDKEKIFIPGRNIMFLLFSAVIGYYDNRYELVLSLHKSDTISGDCKIDFTEAFQHALTLGMSTPKYPVEYKIIAPLKDMEKWEAIQVGASLGIDFSESWSCDDSKEEHCGVCQQCTERKKMFNKANITDPTIYLQ